MTRPFKEDMYFLAHVTGWEPYDLHSLARTSWVGPVFLCTEPVHLTTADTGYAANDLYDLHHHLSEVCNCFTEEAC